MIVSYHACSPCDRRGGKVCYDVDPTHCVCIMSDTNVFEVFGKHGDVYSYNITLKGGFDTALYLAKLPREDFGDFDMFLSKCVPLLSLFIFSCS